ncbi:MAG: hypothetical protein DMG40_04175 [Acidobacteria bacterium]|nr:MAG: hypothetical protein DMG40_04175 [Acidobacteriota bacterium]
MNFLSVSETNFVNACAFGRRFTLSLKGPLAFVFSPGFALLWVLRNFLGEVTGNFLLRLTRLGCQKSGSMAPALQRIVQGR